MKELSFIPKSISLSRFGEGQGVEDPIEFGQNDQAIENAFQENYFLFVLKSLPKDRYRVVALLLLLRSELGYEYTYQDIGSIWGTGKSNIAKIIDRIQDVCTDKKMAPSRRKKLPVVDPDQCRVNFLSFIGYNQ